jgi:hypothetical protein
MSSAIAAHGRGGVARRAGVHLRANELFAIGVIRSERIDAEDVEREGSEMSTTESGPHT